MIWSSRRPDICERSRTSSQPWARQSPTAKRSPLISAIWTALRTSPRPAPRSQASLENRLRPEYARGSASDRMYGSPEIRGKAVAENTPKTPGTFDPEALLAIQRRNVEAFTSAGKIVAEGMRTYAERQAGLMQEAMRNLWGEVQTRTRAPG